MLFIKLENRVNIVKKIEYVVIKKKLFNTYIQITFENKYQNTQYIYNVFF